MKRLQIGFVAIIAILAMSFSMGVTPHSAVTNFKITDGCYDEVAVSFTDPFPPVTVTLTAPDVVILGTPPFANQEQSNQTVVKISKSKFPGKLADLILALWYLIKRVSGSKTPATQCPSPYQKFCCFKVENTTINGVTGPFVVAIIFRSN